MLFLSFGDILGRSVSVLKSSIFRGPLLELAGEISPLLLSPVTCVKNDFFGWTVKLVTSDELEYPSFVTSTFTLYAPGLLSPPTFHANFVFPLSSVVPKSCFSKSVPELIKALTSASFMSSFVNGSITFMSNS